MKVFVWLRYAAVTSLALAAAVLVTSLILDRSFASTLEWSLVVASFGGAVGSTSYRQALSVPAFSWHAFGVWALSTIWGASWLLIAISWGADSPRGSIAFDAAAMLGLAAATSMMCFFPLRWLGVVSRPRGAL